MQATKSAMILLAVASFGATATAQLYPRSSRLPRDEVKVNENFVNNAVHGYGSWRIACPSERLPAGPAGTVPTANVCYMTYLDTDASGVESVRFRRSIDGGWSWESAQVLYTVQTNEVFSTGDTRIVASEHDVFIVWASNGHTLVAGEQAVFAIGSDDQGQTWTAPTLLSPEFLTTLRDADEVNCAISRNGAAASLNVVFESDTPTAGNEDIYFVQAEVQGGALNVTVPTTRLNVAWTAQQFDVDFTAIDCDGPVVHVIWCDDRSGVSNDYFSMTSRNNGTDWATIPEYQHTVLPTLSWAAPRRPRAAVDLPNVYTFMEHSLNGQDDVWMDWSQDLGLTWGATGVAINTLTLGSGGDIDDMLVVAQNQRVAVLYVDDRLNGSNNNANNQAVVAVSNNGGLDFVNGTHVEVPLSQLDPNPIYDIYMAGDMIAAMYENNCGGGEGITVSLSSDGGQTFEHLDVTSFDGCGTFPSGVDVDNPRMCLTANGDCNILWQDDRTFAGTGGGNTVNNLWVSGIKYPRLIDNTASNGGVMYQNDAASSQGLQCYVFFSLSSAPNTIPLDTLGTTLNIGYDPLTEASVIIATQSLPSVNRDLVGANGSVNFPLIPNVGQLLGLPVYAIGATVDNNGGVGPFTDPILMQ
ncbi:MAG: hypothetical protein ACE37K_06810 [Planctomycetota bacterium]